MATSKQDPLSQSEWKIMKIVWEQKSCAARDVYAVAQKKHGWAMSTVKTLLRRLVDKGYLNARQVGNSFLYTPTQSAYKTLCRFADDLLSYALDGTVAPVMAYMVKKSDMSRDEIAELRAMLDEYEERQGDES